MPGKLSCFVGSSTEGLDWAYAIQENLEMDFDVTVWNQDVFALTEPTIDSLLKTLDRSDFGIFVISPDDEIKKRGIVQKYARDNVIFELGLFIGRLGRERTFMVQPRDLSDLKLPTDLWGVQSALFNSKRSDHSDLAALGPACNKIRKQALKLPLRRRDILRNMEIEYVAAIPYRNSDDDPEFLLVKTTRGRLIFPKGKIRVGEAPESAARRYAHDEGGAIGEICQYELMPFDYLKEDEGKKHTILPFILEVKTHVEPAAQFRSPKWYKLSEAENAIPFGRSYAHFENIIECIRQADAILRQKTEPKWLSAALPFRRMRVGIEVMLITSTHERDWILPKGHIPSGISPAESAAKEAFEEAGVSGRVAEISEGYYSYIKRGLTYNVEVFPFEVETESSDWKEKNRRRKWFSIEEAVKHIGNEMLAEIVANFSERYIGPSL